MEAQLLNVNLDEIEVGDTNKMFRDDNDFTPEALQELVDSIMKAGVITPILLRPGKKKKYELVAGERRFRASVLVQTAVKDRKTIPANIRTLTDEEALEAQVIENLQRENVNPMKEAIAFDWMTMTKKMTTKQISDRIGKSIDYVQERIRLTTLHKDAQELVRTGVLPLKAALKLATIPQVKHQDALRSCITTIEGAHGKVQTFTGLEGLQRWLSWNIFNDLAYADFHTNDASLVPAAGSCTACTKRTRNAGGLFDDIAKKDCCFDAVCFRNKQLANYKANHENAKLDAKGSGIFFLQRTHSLDNDLKKSLEKIDKVVSFDSALEEITKSQFEKDNKVFENITKLKIAVLVGIDRYDGEDSKKKFKYFTTKKSTSSKSTGNSNNGVDHKKEKEDRQKNSKQRFFEKTYTAEAFLKQAATKTINEDSIRELIAKLFDDMCNNEEACYILKAMRLPWTMSKFDGGKKKSLKITGTEDNLNNLIDDYGGPSEDELLEAIKNVKGEKLNALLAYALYSTCSYDLENVILKRYKIDSKPIANKAKADTATWWKSQAVEKVKAGKGSVVQKAKKLAALK